ncbi:hypothetical protein ACFVYJ_10360 [Pontibacter sp. JAM-7]|uniref:hypothetical protein n=1 Tax=Pontibacter sp. JAM-7 TaxID=3366581 RepID=UPI003AF7F64F
MIQKLYSGLCLLILCGLLGGCFAGNTTKPATLPSQLTQSGMVMLQISPTLSWGKAEIAIEGEVERKAHNGFYLNELKPGKYVMQSLTLTSGYASSYNGVSQKNTTYYKRLRLDFEFEIKAGQVTNLGMVYIHPDRKGDRYNILRLKNGDSGWRYLQDYHPVLAKNLSADQMRLVDAQYVNEQIDVIRTALLSDMHNPPKGKVGDTPDLTLLYPAIYKHHQYLVGELGTLLDDSARPANTSKFYNTGTLDRITGFSFTGERAWFLSERGKVLRRAGDRLTEVAVPKDFFAIRGALYADLGVVLVDRNFNLLVSDDDGVSWTKYSQGVLPGEEMPDGNFNMTHNGVYAIGRQYAWIGGHSTAVFVDMELGLVSPFKLPKGIANDLRSIYNTDLGIFLHGVDSGNPDKVYFKADGDDQWQVNEILIYRGCQLSFPENTGEKVIAECRVLEGKKNLVSVDFGKTWSLM